MQEQEKKTVRGRKSKQTETVPYANTEEKIPETEIAKEEPSAAPVGFTMEQVQKMLHLMVLQTKQFHIIVLAQLVLQTLK